MRICVQPSTVPSIEVDLEVKVSQLAIRSARRRHHDDEWPVFANILFGVPLVLIRVEIDPAHQVDVLANGKLASNSQSRCPGLSSAEFADVKAPDVPLAEGATRLSSSLKPGGTTLARKKVGVEGERNFSEEDLNRRSPNSDQWGLFVSLTPPMEYYSANQKQSGNPNIAEAKR